MKKLLLVIGLLVFTGCAKDEMLTPAFVKNDRTLAGTRWEFLFSAHRDKTTFMPEAGEHFFYHFIDKNTLHISMEINQEVILVEEKQYKLQGNQLIIDDGDTKVWTSIEELSEKKLTLRSYQEMALATRLIIPSERNFDWFKKAE